MGINLLPDVFEKAADAIRDRGHHKGDYINPDGCVCALGALGVALKVDYRRSEWDGTMVPVSISDEYMWYGSYLQDFLQEYEGQDGWETVPEWNDAEERTPEEAEKFLRACAQDLREEYESWHKA